MTRDKFNELWDHSFIPLSQAIENSTGLLFDKKKKRDIYLCYEEIKNNHKELMQNCNGPLDRHKIASSIVHSLLKICPFPVVIGDGYTFFQRTANEAFALYVAIQVVTDFALTKAKDAGDGTLQAILEYEFIFPEVRNKHNDPYQIFFIKTLYNSRINHEANVSLLSNAFFVLEAYHVRECKNMMKLAV